MVRGRYHNVPGVSNFVERLEIMREALRKNLYVGLVTPLPLTPLSKMSEQLRTIYVRPLLANNLHIEVVHSTGGYLETAVLD